MITRTQIQVHGLVQGVGFRPFVFSLARRRALHGKVCNNEAGVLIDVEGDPRAIEQFVAEIRLQPPPLSAIEAIVLNDLLPPLNFKEFSISDSQTKGAKAVPIAADVATCEDCLRELFDPNDRRYRYPFINCTNCGPRFTIVEGVPYDRAQTTMREFEMCADCRAEYEDPSNRRFHAEPTACPVCGPQMLLRSERGVAKRDAIERAQELLLRGMIVAIKGLGGFHLACDALNHVVVERLRQKKYREDKPFALMADSIETIDKYCKVSQAEKSLLASPQRPIVLLNKRASVKLSEKIAPGVKTLGFMLPYMPLHHLLVANIHQPLVMTSGNVSDEPICYCDDDADERLHKIADYYLTHDRRIHMRADDSVVRAFRERPYLQRRSRGYAPAPIKTSFKFSKQILACGAELKNTFCLTRGQHAFVSQHIGDLENLETLRSYAECIDHYRWLFDLRPEVIVHDLHPEYLSTKYALASDEIETKLGVQHHHAHIASCLADNLVEGEVIGVAMDGLGFGTDGRLWGGEFFVADFNDAERIAHLDYVPMPGAASAVREPWRMAAIYLHRALGDEFACLELPFVRALSLNKWTTLRAMAASGTNSPETSSMGRLFDAVAAVLGLRVSVNYEGQAAIELETLADEKYLGSYELPVEDGGVIKAEPMIERLVGDLLNGCSPSEVSTKFHRAIVKLISTVACQTRSCRGLNRVALSGGVFQNMFLLQEVCGLLELQGFEVLTHSRVPTNDGGISLGQAAVANARLRSGRI